MKTSDSSASSNPFPPPESRSAKGEWRPSYAISYAPLFTWPPKPLALIRWVLNYPGFMWPRNLLLLAISTVSWFLTQPALARCAQFKWDWLAQIWVRNLALAWLVYGGYYYFLYILKIDGTRTKYDSRWPAKNSRVFLFHNQLYDNIFWTAGVAVLIWTAFEAVTLWLYANHRIPYLSWAAHPVFFVLWFFAIPFWREFHFYWIHRLIHWKPLYKRIHYLHHKNINPNPWSGMAMHPLETAAYLSVVLIHWVVPSHPFHFLFDLQHAALGAACSHHGFDGPLLDGKWPTGSYFHYLHHRYFECNYGDATLPLDRMFGTFRDGLPDGAGSRLPGEHRDSPANKVPQTSA